MPLQKMQFRPGVVREVTSLSNKGGWYDCDKVRFRFGFPEKIGGWAPESYNTFFGVCRSLFNWITLRGFNLLGVGTNFKFYIESGGSYYDVTPIRETNTNPSNQITLTIQSGAPTMTIVDANAEALQAGDIIKISGAVDLGSSGTNITASVLNQEYLIAFIASSTTYAIYLRDANTSVAGETFSVYNVATATLYFPDSPALANGLAITILPSIAVPGGLASGGVIYYVVNASGGYCQLAFSPGGPPVQISDVGSGRQAAYFLLSSNRTASSSTMTGLTIAYQINSGQAVYTIGTGWGTGAWVPYASTTLTNPFDTLNASSTITVTQSGHGLTTGDYVYFQSIASSDISGISNIVLQRAFPVTVTGGSTYTISTVIGEPPGPVITYTANATASGLGGSVVVLYPSATVDGSFNRPWGSGSTTGFGQQLRLWSQSNFGQNLLFSPRGGALYIWDPGTGGLPNYTVRGTVVSGLDVPSKINQILVSDSTRIVIAFGANEYGPYDTTAQDPMLIRWSDQEDYTVWGDTETNQAGSFRLSYGSYIVGAFQTRQEILVWTDAAIYSMQYLGPPFVWGFTLLSDNISIVSPNAMASAAGVVFWMGVDKFYVYSGRVDTLPCAVRAYVFNDINRAQLFQCFASTNEGFSEIWWFYPSITGPDGTGTAQNPNTIIDRYVIFNHVDRVWYYGSLSRTAWLDSPLRDFPIAATDKNLLVYHEAAVDDGTTNPPSPINAYIQSSDFDITDGNNYSFVTKIIPDVTFNGSNTSGESSTPPSVEFTIRPKQNPGAPYGASLPKTVQSAQQYQNQSTYTVQEFTEIIYPRIRGRQVAFKIESDTLGTQWQLGSPLLDVRPDGRR